jgi:pimeloyl-ACP methyl ester carboxylesterase
MVAGWMWFGQAEDLGEYRCLIPDLPGFDHSARDEWDNFAGVADRLEEMIVERCADRSAHVVGLSLGGIAGLHLAIRHPDAVRSLVVSGVPQGAVPVSLRVLSRLLLWLYTRPWGARIVATIFGIPNDESRDAFLATAARTNPRALGAVMSEVNERPLPAALDQLTMPVLAVVGERDSRPRSECPRHAVVVRLHVGQLGAGTARGSRLGEHERARQASGRNHRPPPRGSELGGALPERAGQHAVTPPRTRGATHHLHPCRGSSEA